MFLILIFAILGITPYTLTQSTNFVNQDSKVSHFDEPQWLKDNIPFLEVPDKEIEEVYYYRFTLMKRHLRYNLPGAGYSVTEFVHSVGYSQKFDSINAAAGHHIDEIKWLRNTRYLKDYINFWAREGAGNQQYSEWIATTSYDAYLLNGDANFIKSIQKCFVKNYNDWDDHFEPALGLYFISPLWDAMEFSAPSLPTDDPFGGGVGYRPSFNAEMYANALAISKIATLNDDIETALTFHDKAEALREAMLKSLWDNDRTFFYHVNRDDNPTNAPFETREEIGFYPFRWSIPPKSGNYAAIWDHLFDPEAFDSAYGPTTCEQRSQYFDGNQTDQCCWWNGNSWPYSTGMTLKALASQVRNYASTPTANVNSFTGLLHKYAETSYKDGIPYVAECHSPLYDFWVCDSRNHSEHYAHSTYIDNVLSDLIGIESQEGDAFQVSPLIPESWPYFIAENILYHGHNITVLYDQDGSKYGVGAGFKIYVNGLLAASQPQVGRLRVNIYPAIEDPNYGKKKVENYAANVNSQGYPMLDASFTSNGDSVWQAADGRIFYDHIPSNRWTSFGSGNQEDWLSVDFGPGRQKNISQVKLYIYSDVAVGHDIDCPTAIRVEYMNGNNWVAAENQMQTPAVCSRNDIMIIDFTPVRTQQVRVIFTNDFENNYYVGITELEIWANWPQSSEGSYEAEDGLLRNANIHDSESASSGSYVGQIDADDAFVEFTGVWVDAEGLYEVLIYYANAEDVTASLVLTLNNLESVIVQFPQSNGGWGEFDPDTFVSVQVPLLRGNNVLVFSHQNNFAELDKITVM